MAGAIAKLYATLGLDTRGFDKGLTQSQTKTKSFMSNFKQQAMAGFGIGAGMGAFNLAARGVGAAVDVIGDAIGAAMEEAAGIATLTRAIEENDKAWDGNVDAVEEVIRARTALGFADDEQRASLQKLVTVTQDVDKALELQATAMNLARLRGMDLSTAGDLIGKVYAGNLGTLSRYGIVLKKGATAAEAMAEIQRRVTGQAEAYADTTQGKLVAAQLAMNDAMEDFGAALMPIVTDLLPHLTNAANLLADVFAKPSLQSQSFKSWVDGLDGVVEGVDAITDAAAEAGAGIGTWEDIWADTPLGDLNPAMKEAVLMWRDYHTELEKVGLTFNDFKDGLYDVKTEMGVTGEEALTMIRQWAVMDDVGKQASAAVDAMAGSIRGALGSMFGVHVDPPDIAGPIEDEMAAARKAVLDGFGSIKDALKKGSRPQLISRSDRISNMESRQGKINKQLNRAVEADDPFNVRYWASAAAKQQVQLDRLRNGTGTKLRDVKSKYSAAGIDIERIWGRTGDAIERESQASADAAIAAAQSIKTGIDAIDLTASGVSLMAELAAGIRSNIAAVSAAASLAATAANPRASVGAGAGSAASAGGGGGAGHTTYVVGTLIANDNGIDELDRRITRRRRLRDRGPMRYKDD